MQTKIHPTAIIGDKVELGLGVEVGPYSFIEGKVFIGEGTIIKSHTVIEGDTTIGKNNLIYPFVTIGMKPQDLKFKGEESKVVIGDGNTIRENATIHRGTEDGGLLTRIGSNCLLMVGVHIAHDCRVGDHVILANNATLAGHVIVEDKAIIGGLSAIHQFVRIGKGAMIGGMSGIESDVIPYGLAMGERACLAGLNLIGMKRDNVKREDIHSLRNFFKKLFSKDGECGKESFLARVEELSREFSTKESLDIVEFIKRDSARSFCQPKQI